MPDTVTAENAVRRAIQTAPARHVMVRFSHVDAAGIVFYPRFLEMFAQAFPELLAFETCCDMKMEFRKPILLGDTLSLVLDAGSVQEKWRLSGRIGNTDHLSVRWEARSGDSLPPDAHRPDTPAFVSDAIPVQEWCVGPTSRLQFSRYYEFVNTAIEQWFARDLDWPFRRLNDDRQGIPTVTLETSCTELPRLGDQLRIWIRPLRVGGRSLRFASYLVHDRKCLIKTNQVIVFVSFSPEGARSIELPELLRDGLQKSLV